MNAVNNPSPVPPKDQLGPAPVPALEAPPSVPVVAAPGGGGSGGVVDAFETPMQPARIGWIVVGLFFGVLGTWSAVAPLASAVVAPGTVVVESNRKAIQHLEGGIVSEILVRDGDVVQGGDVLLRLEQTQAKANADMLMNQYYNHRAVEARLQAELEGYEQIEFPADLLSVAWKQSAIQGILDGQVRQFDERRRSLDNQVSILQARIEQYHQEIEGLKVQKKSGDRQVAIYKDELVGLRELYEKGWYPRTRILSMEREVARLQGDIGAQVASVARAEKGIGEAELQIIQTRQRFKEEAVSQLRDIQQQLADLRERGTVATNILERTEIKASQDGVVQNLKVHTVAGVVRPGETLMEIVPEKDRLVIDAEVSPVDIDSVHAGQEAEVRFSSFQSRSIPTITGTVLTVSADRLIDERMGIPYYTVRVEVPETELVKLGDNRLQAGMPAEVLIQTGERTVLDYFIRPLRDSMTRAMVEK
ncbi:HlyD family type I secretion periplasmic adaptor subunit [Haematospirillum jordaniae]|uniref:Membrane fusion protein (MFP) family protein n=1 Tax=Haematospirillum jordaniae TaxID=1549855 RepID=A0A143DGB8_9PROT|nr:HlyD family type I secretion periplasmic adaptor subunit [Haematospirillum jordaniae]AMW35771.1 hypothetical protein AY555_10350 [Haematospirillum jordaniae]NKD45700.1 HlyD family type I secretion periplasmic adaptor subunit [Haematospirillum jordaniae]NKD57743.1 HlyD family type I secretion periplasmic adaptor subunit [Haematospirillum jordaniae]NKD59772.1 HlyD family type I secretion periplasmic adaptor subunit [Haematospirillum jordaniae]NKD67571.1 HlyD family type I secretion periplasmi